jgi:putative methyltransferase (TIGR04325 family)
MFIKIARMITPPFFVDLYRFIYGFRGDYKSWNDAVKDSVGYDSDIILSKVLDSSLKVIDGKAAYERDSVTFQRIQYSWPLLTGLLWIASYKKNRLNIVDYGGSLGSSYRQNEAFLKHLQELRWSIVEQKKFVRCGKEHFENEHLKFYYDLKTCCFENQPDAILFSGVIQYLEKPYAFLEEVLSYKFDFLIFDRTTFIESGEDRLTIQKAKPTVYKASYPAWFFNREKFLSFLLRDYELVAEFDALAGSIRIGNRYGNDKGFIFSRRNNNWNGMERQIHESNSS